MGAILLSCVIYSYFFNRDYRLELRKERTEVVTGRITRKYMPKSGGSFLDFSYKYGGQEMESGRYVTGVVYSPERFVNRFFPVVVSIGDPEESAILLTPKDFAFFNKEFPDSLSWVIQFVHESQK